MHQIIFMSSKEIRWKTIMCVFRIKNKRMKWRRQEGKGYPHHPFPIYKLPSMERDISCFQEGDNEIYIQTLDFKPSPALKSETLGWAKQFLLGKAVQTLELLWASWLTASYLPLNLKWRSEKQDSTCKGGNFCSGAECKAHHKENQHWVKTAGPNSHREPPD